MLGTGAVVGLVPEADYSERRGQGRPRLRVNRTGYGNRRLNVVYRDVEPMEVAFGPQANALYSELRPVKAGSTNEVGDGIYLDFDEEGELRGIELLYVSLRAPEVAKGHVDIRLPIAAEK